jgi:hypothetical protein
MVQDLKRGNSVRRRESVLGLGARETEGDDGSIGGALVLGEPLGRRRTRDSLAEEGGGARTPSGARNGNANANGSARTGRGRSLSALSTLSGLWRGIRGQSSRENLAAEHGSRDLEGDAERDGERDGER